MEYGKQKMGAENEERRTEYGILSNINKIHMLLLCTV